MSTDKPPDFLATLGPEIKMDSVQMENDPWAQMTLKDIGKTLTKDQVAAGMKYVGSFAIHIVRTEQSHGAITGQWHMNSLTQIALEPECSEQLGTLGFNNAVVALRRYFNPGFKSHRRGDKR